MAQINDDYLKLPGSYLFADIAHKVNAFKENHPEMELIRLGIGDVTRPLPPSVIKALHKAVDEQATAEGFRGYGPEQGYRFLREAIAQGDFASRGVEIDPDDIFVSDGAKCDLGNFQELFGRGNVIAVTDPVYPVYVDSNVMGGRAGTFDGNGSWSGIVYLPCSAENGFVPSLPLKRPDVIYLCLPNNPTGTALSRPELQRWVDYARSNQCLILFDAAYEAYIREDGIPHSIYELEGAKEVAVEFRSFSKPAGFTGLRCGYVVIPETVKARAADGRMLPLKPLWNRRQTTKFNGVSYINDSIATSPTRTIAGLRAMRTKPILIAGGHDKHVSFDRLADEIAERVKALYLTGDTAEQIEKAVRKSVFFDPSRLPIYVVPDLKTAVEEARAHSIPGDVVLLSPACSSFDRFKNFAERGDTFRKIVLEFEGNETE